MKLEISIIRVDPVRQLISPMRMRAGRNATPEVKRICRARAVGHREVLDVDGTMLVVAGGLDVDESMRGWRLLGGEDTAGIGMLFGKGPNGGMVSCPVDVAWVRSRIKWMEGEDPAAIADRAAETLPMCSLEIRNALVDVLVMPTGDMWVNAAHTGQFPAMQALGLSSSISNGRRLTPLGEAVHDLLIAQRRG